MKHNYFFISLLSCAAGAESKQKAKPASRILKAKPASRILLAPAAASVVASSVYSLTGAASVVASLDYISVYSLTGQQSGTPSGQEIDEVDAVFFENSPEFAQNFYLSPDKQSIIINSLTGGLFSCTYTLNPQSNYPCIAYLEAYNTTYFPAWFILPGSQLSIPETQSPGTITLTVTFQLPPGQTNLRLMFNGAISPQNSTSGHANNQTNNFQCVSASLTVTRLQ